MPNSNSDGTVCCPEECISKRGNQSPEIDCPHCEGSFAITSEPSIGR